MNKWWLHISDLHFSKKMEIDSNRILNALIEAVKSNVKDGMEIEGIFVTGDIANSAEPEEYLKATEFFERLLIAANVDRSTLFIVPGNHDVQRKKQKNLSRTLSDEFASQEYFAEPDEQIHNKLKFANFRKWYDDFFSETRKYSENGSVILNESYNSQSGRMSIVGINTAIFSADESDHGKLWIGRDCLDNALSSFDKNAEFKILMLHHPIEWIHDAERVQLESKIRSEFDVVLHGHMHQLEAFTISSTNDSALFIKAGASYQTSRYKNTASFISFRTATINIKPITYSDTPTEKWTLDTTFFPETDEYIGVHSRAKKGLGAEQSKIDKLELSVTATCGHEEVISAKNNSVYHFEEALLVSRAGQPLYVEPRLMTVPHGSYELTEETDSVAVSEIVSDKGNYLIDGKSEYGLSTLGQRLVRDFSKDGCYSPTYKNAHNLPNYKKKLSIELESKRIDSVKSVLILEDVNFERHERLVKEILSLNIYDRYIFLTRSRFITEVSTEPSYITKIEPKCLYLWPLSRADVRTLTQLQFESGDELYISSIVEKVYEDLIKLCIPLTPSNVIMYLEILYKEGEFQPLNRVNILERYISEMLRKPSEYYRDSFNLKNKMDLISDFVFHLYKDRHNSFDDQKWKNYCNSYKNKKLLDFDESSFLRDLQDMRVIANYDGKYHFKYGFYYSYFLGRHIAYRPNILKEFLTSEDYFSTPNIIEVISGLSVDNSELVKNLLASLSSYIDQFSEKYIPRDFDPFSEALWIGSELDDEKIWRPLQEKIEAGPQDSRDVDVLKSTASREARSADQEIKFQELKQLEIHMFHVNKLLGEALINADDIDGDLKKSALNAILQCNLIAFQIGLTLAPEMLRERFVAWGGIAFLDFNYGLANKEGSDDYKIARICHRLLFQLAKNPRDCIGTQKLGEAHKGLLMAGCESDFAMLANFNCVLASKPSGWEDSLLSVLKSTDKNSYYFAVMLTLLYNEFKLGLNQSRDLDALKRLIAFIRAKRESRKNAPGKSSIAKMLARLEVSNHFTSRSN